MQKIFNEGDYLFYPQLCNLYREVIENPDYEIELPDHLFDRNDPPNTFAGLVKRVCLFACKVWEEVKKTWNPAYRLKCAKAANLVQLAYLQKQEVLQNEKSAQDAEQRERVDQVINRDRDVLTAIEKYKKNTSFWRLTKISHLEEVGVAPEYVQMIENATKASLQVLEELSKSLPASVPKLEQVFKKKPYERMCLDADRIVDPEFTEVWQTLFAKFNPESIVTEWTLNEQGAFTLSLLRRIQLWVPSTDEEGKVHPKGGICMLMDRLIQGKLTSIGFEFDQGYRAFMKTEIPGLEFLGPKEFTADIVRLTFDHRERYFKFAAGKIFRFPLLGTYKKAADRIKTKEYLLTNWSQNSEVIEGDFRSHLLQKYETDEEV